IHKRGLNCPTADFRTGPRAPEDVEGRDERRGPPQAGVLVTSQRRSTVGLGRRGPKLIKELKPRKAPGLDGVNNKAIKCFSAPLVALLVAIFNACIQNCHFPEAWKEAVIIGIPKPEKPRDLPTSYRPISPERSRQIIRESPQITTQ
ncbi:Probable RNA-directed DNA polymerase from transposon BS, partial [Eumeta japonica]